MGIFKKLYQKRQEGQYLTADEQRYISRSKFKALFGENPEDVLGNDWENYIQEYFKNN